MSDTRTPHIEGLRCGEEEGCPHCSPIALIDQWGVRYLNLDDEPVYIADSGREKLEAAMADGDVLVHRFVTAWTAVPTTPADPGADECADDAASEWLADLRMDGEL